MISIDRNNMAVMMEAGYVYVGMKRFKEARDVFAGIAVLVPDSEVPHVALGNVDFCEGKLLSAVKHYHQALKVDPESMFAKVYLGEAFLFMGKRTEAFELLQEVAKKDKTGAGDFARALLSAVKKGFSPPKKDAKN